VYPQARVVIRPAEARPRDLLSLFIQHLALQLSNQMDLPSTSLLICKDQVWEFGPTDDAAAILGLYFKNYQFGLRQPLLLFERSSYAYAEAILVKAHKAVTSLAIARRLWEGNEFMPGESADPYHKRCFGNQDPLIAEFEEKAVNLFSPLLRVALPLPALEI
jgi:exodeoxyribonuclease V gamma subunit